KAPAKKAAPKKAAPKAKKDDLKKIEGIGPKIAGLLNEAGIVTFSDLAKASKAKLAGVLEAAGPRFRLAKPDTWQQQAKLAAAGKDAELAKLQKELKGGVKK
ncbi:MAG: helix-hairpin-helix domain-containing protein, partial [Bacteroidota bacterium]